MEASIKEVARLAGTTSRTLRHYDAIGLLPPSRVGHQGYRYYDQHALVRLQQILLLRDLGLGLDAIGRVLDARTDEVQALRTHLAWLDAETERLARLRATVARTITTLENGEELMAEEILDGFDHTQYREEVEQRWGAAAYAAGDAWWRGLSADQRATWKQRQEALSSEWVAAAAAGVEPTSPAAQDPATRPHPWLGDIPGTPGHGGSPVKEYVVGLGEMYVADPRFARHYGGEQGAALVRDALRTYADRHL